MIINNNELYILLLVSEQSDIGFTNNVFFYRFSCL